MFLDQYNTTMFYTFTLIITRWNFLEPETNEIVTQLSYEKKRVLEVIQGLLEPCD